MLRSSGAAGRVLQIRTKPSTIRRRAGASLLLHRKFCPVTVLGRPTGKIPVGLTVSPRRVRPVAERTALPHRPRDRESFREKLGRRQRGALQLPTGGTRFVVSQIIFGRRRRGRPPNLKGAPAAGIAFSYTSARNYAASLTASLCPRILTVCCSCSVLSGFFKTVIGPFARMRSSISLSG